MNERVVLVIDASVALKWILNEPGRAEALVLLDGYESGRLDLVAPRLVMAEVASALSKRYRRGDLTRPQAERAFRLFEERRPILADELEDLRLAFSLSLSHQISLWDAMYLAAAIGRRCDLITADRRLHHALTRHYPFAKMLSAFT